MQYTDIDGTEWDMEEDIGVIRVDSGYEED